MLKQKHHLIVKVNDHGKGITKKQISSPNSLGIVGMRERALTLDGKLTFRGSRSKGTILAVRIPLARVLAGKASQGQPQNAPCRRPEAGGH